MVQAQIESIQGKGDWQGKFGTMYTFEVAFADGTVGEANSKTAEPPYKVGDEVYYEVQRENQYGKKLKISKNPPVPGGFPAPNPQKDKQIIRGMCLKLAGMAWANQYKHKEFSTPHEVLVKDVIMLAKKYEAAFNDWMNEP
jgi:hypothetical protein